MTTSEFRYAFRIVGNCAEERRLVDAAAAFAAYAAADPKAECDREAYLSAFRFAAGFRQHLETTGSTKDFAGPCWSPWLWWDIDADELQYAHKDAAALAAFLVERYGINAGELLLFFSGSKGFHIGLSSATWNPPPSPDFHRTARKFAEAVAELASVTIDAGVYDKVRAFRAPNSRHPKMGLHKRRLTLDELLGPLDAILELAKTPAPFEVPKVTGTSDTAAADWQAAVATVASEGEAKAARRAAGNGSPILNRSTLDFIRDGATNGDRHRLLFSAAANLAEFHCPLPLAAALLEETALDSGLPPKEVRRQIECGLAAVPPTLQIAPQSTQDAANGSTVKQPPKPATSDCRAFEGQSCQELTAEPNTPPTAELQSALARIWQSTPTEGDQGEAVPPLDVQSSPAVPPALGMESALTSSPPPDPPPPHKPPPPVPPEGATLHIVNEKMRPCPPAECYCWTWEGAPQWFHACDYPPPNVTEGGLTP